MQIVSFMSFESDSKHLILLVVRHITFFDKIFNIGSACSTLMCFSHIPDNTYAGCMQY